MSLHSDMVRTLMFVTLFDIPLVIEEADLPLIIQGVSRFLRPHDLWSWSLHRYLRQASLPPLVPLYMCYGYIEGWLGTIPPAELI